MKLSLIAMMMAFILFGHATIESLAQDSPKLTREAKNARSQSLEILDEMEEILKEYYYDPKFKGIDLKQRISAAKERIKTLEFNWQMYRVLAQVLMDFDDSHTNLLLPPRSDYFQYGVSWQMIGDSCFVTSVKKGSDAEAKGIQSGDQVLQIGKYRPTRNDLWKIEYLLYKLDPVNTMDLKIKKLDGSEAAVTIRAKTMTDKEFRAELKANKENVEKKPYRCEEVNKEVIACKLSTFMVEKGDIDKMMRQARDYSKLILDLRGNGGGLVSIEEYLVSHFFDKEILIADVVEKKKRERRLSKVLSADRQYKGEVAVLIDSDSASAAEMTARVLQLQQRARVYGDRSSGSVMTSIGLPFRKIMAMTMQAAIIRVGMSVTVADVIMSDGSRLEKIGVTPDVVLQPTGAAINQKTDPVLAYAAAQMGGELTPEAAGKFFFIIEKSEFVGDADGK